jgi:hypothetical protein
MMLEALSQKSFDTDDCSSINMPMASVILTIDLSRLNNIVASGTKNFSAKCH